jgi:DNA invertase Pin-like site-specific DNA recombinase
VTPIRFAIFAGVSTDKQATEDKQSIPDQIKTCRNAIAAHRGTETAGPYIMDGYSRTDYDSLEIAMQQIPPLQQAIHAAAGDEYDILIMDNFDRLGDLGIMVGTRFRKLRKQLHSVRQSGIITPPDQYDPYASESEGIDMLVQSIIQRYRINKIRRAWNVGVPDRAQKGLHPLGSIPFGYRNGGKDQPAQIIHDEAQLVIQLKDRYLAGKTLQNLVEHANRTLPPRRADAWSRPVIKRMILRPFYAGIIRFREYIVVDKKRRLQPPSKWILAKGQHTPLWDESTYLAILAEAERRDSTRTRAQTHTLSGLLQCSTCGGKLHRHGKINSKYPLDLECKNGCISIYYNIALKLTANTFTKAIQHFSQTPSQYQLAESIDAQIAEQQQLRIRVQDGFETRLYTPDEAHARIITIETEIDRLTRQRERLIQTSVNRDRIIQLAATSMDKLKHTILHGDPTTINQLLTTLCEAITIDKHYNMKVIWR